MHVEVQNIRCDIPPRKSRHYAEFTDTYRLEIAVIWVFGLYHTEGYALRLQMIYPSSHAL